MIFKHNNKEYRLILLCLTGSRIRVLNKIFEYIQNSTRIDTKCHNLHFCTDRNLLISTSCSMEANSAI